MCTTGAPVNAAISSDRVVLPEPAGPSTQISRPLPRVGERSSTSSSTRSALVGPVAVPIHHLVRRCRAA